MENGPGLKMCCLLKNGDIPASYVSVPEGISWNRTVQSPRRSSVFSLLAFAKNMFAQVDGLETWTSHARSHQPGVALWSHFGMAFLLVLEKFVWFMIYVYLMWLAVVFCVLWSYYRLFFQNFGGYEMLKKKLPQQTSNLPPPAIPEFELLLLPLSNMSNPKVLLEASETLFTHVRETLSQLQGKEIEWGGVICNFSPQVRST